MKFEIGQKIKVINDKRLEGNEFKPPIKIGEEYTIKDIILDSKENQHLDIGIPSKLNWIRSWETKEELPKGDSIHWCHPSRFELIK